MKRLLGLVGSFFVLFTQVAFAEDVQLLQKLEEAIESNRARIALISGVPASSESGIDFRTLKVLPLSQQENLDKPKCAETDFGILVCTIKILDSCHNLEGLISMTLSYLDAEDLVSPKGKNSFPHLVAKYEHIGIPLIGCLGDFDQDFKKKPAN